MPMPFLRNCELVKSQDSMLVHLKCSWLYELRFSIHVIKLPRITLCRVFPSLSNDQMLNILCIQIVNFKTEKQEVRNAEKKKRISQSLWQTRKE